MTTLIKTLISAAIKAEKTRETYVVRSLWGKWFFEKYVKPYTPTTEKPYYLIGPDEGTYIHPLKHIREKFSFDVKEDIKN